MQTNTTFGIIAGILIVVLLAGALSLFLQPSEQKGDIFLINKGNSNSTDTTECFNVGTGSQVIKNSTDGNCYVRSLLGSPDISVTQQANTITIDFNGTAGESTQCINIGSQTVIIKNSTSGNCYVKSITTTAKGITLTNSSDTLTISTNFANGTGILITGSTQQTFKTNFTNGTGISITGTTSQTITNTGVISGSCSVGISCSGTNPLTITPNYQLLCQNSLGSSASSLSCSSFTGKSHLYIEYTLYGTTANYLVALTFNSDTGTNYSYRLSNNYAADTGAVSRKNATMNGNNLVTSGTMTGYLHCENDASHRKLCNGENTTDANTGSATTVNFSEFSIKWDNTSNQITTVSIVRGATGTGNLNTGSNISIWGYD